MHLPSVALTNEDSARQRNRSGSVVLDKRIKTWNFFYWDDGKRRSKELGQQANIPRRRVHGVLQNHCAMQSKTKSRSTPSAQHRT